MLQEAERRADELGLSLLTLAGLTARLGVRQPSVYEHIDGMNGLQRGLGVRAKRELAAILAHAAIGCARGDAATAIAHAYRAWAREHPGRCAASQHAPATGEADDIAASQAVVTVVTAVLAAYQLRDDDAIHATRTLRSTLHGLVTLELAGDFGLTVDVDRSFDRLIRWLNTALINWTHHPTPHTPTPPAMTTHTTHVDVAADDGIVAGAPLRMLRLAGAAIAAGALHRDQPPGLVGGAVGDECGLLLAEGAWTCTARRPWSQRIVRKNVRMSDTRSSGASIAAKWSPCSKSVQWVMLLACSP